MGGLIFRYVSPSQIIFRLKHFSTFDLWSPNEKRLLFESRMVRKQKECIMTLDENMVLFATSAGAQFDCPVKNLPTVSIEKILRYGFQRWVNDYANAKGSGESDQTKRDLASVRIGDLIKGEFGNRSRMPTADDETNIRRKVTLEALSAKDRKALEKLPDKGVAKLVEIWEANEATLRPLFDAEVLRREEKAKAPKIKLSGIAI